jgi:hypothetical protein
VSADPIAAIKAGNYLKVPMLVGNTRDEGKLFPALLPLAGGSGSGRLIDDATCSRSSTSTIPTRPRSHARAMDPGGIPPGDDAGHRLHRPLEKLTQVFFLNSRDSVLAAAQSQQRISGTTDSIGMKSRRPST